VEVEMMATKLGKCEIPNCQNPAKYALYKTFPDGKKEWLHVCEKHDKEIGHENILRARRKEGER